MPCFRRESTIRLALLAILAATATAVYLHAFGSGADETPVRALVVVGDASAPAEGDQAMIDRIGTSLGYDTHVVDDDEIPADDEGFDLVVVSKSVDSEKVGDRFKDFAGGFWTFEDNLQPISVDERPMMAFIDQRDPSSTDWHAPTETWYVAGEARDELRSGLSGPIEVYRSADESSYAPVENLAAGAITVVELSTRGDGRAPYYAYDVGATLADGSLAAGRRVFFGLYHTGSRTTFESLTPAGLALFDASIDWASSVTG